MLCVFSYSEIQQPFFTLHLPCVILFRMFLDISICYKLLISLKGSVTRSAWLWQHNIKFCNNKQENIKQNLTPTLVTQHSHCFISVLGSYLSAYKTYVTNFKRYWEDKLTVYNNNACMTDKIKCIQFKLGIEWKIILPSA